MDDNNNNNIMPSSQRRNIRRSLGSFFKNTNNNNNHNINGIELNSAEDIERDSDRRKVHQNRLNELRKRLQYLKSTTRTSNSYHNNNGNDEEEKMPQPTASTANDDNSLWHELSALDPTIADSNDYIQTNQENNNTDDNESNVVIPPASPPITPISSNLIQINEDDAKHNDNIERVQRSKSYSHRPRHRRSNAISSTILPFITSSDNEHDEHDEEEKSMQPIARRTPNTAPYTESDIVALRRKARERKLRRTHAMFQVQPQHHHSNNHNPFRQHRSFRTSSLNASNMACLHHSHRRASTNSISPHHRYKRGSTSGMHTYRNQVRTHRTHHGHHNNNNTHSHRPRLRQPFIPTVDSTTERRNRAPGSAPRNRPPRRRGAFLPHRASHHEDNASTNQRSEEIARLLQQRDSLLQHFNDTISRSGNGHAHSSSFDINALRQRNVPSGAFTLAGNNGNNTRHGRSHSTIVTALNSRVDLTYLPIRCVQASDLGKGNESSSNCSICQEKFKIGDKVKTLPCFHFFHVEEIDRWLTGSRACPVCRHSIDHVNFK
eukprot:433536_1